MILTFNQKSVRAISFGPFIIFRDEETANDTRTNIHEMIHFLQQLELLFVGMWILYLYFYFKGRCKGWSHWWAYRNNPFEKEAYDNEYDSAYLWQRKLYAWTKYLRK